MRLSLITVCRNSVRTLKDTLSSVARQRLPSGTELEYIVVDGGSTDGTVDLIREYAALHELKWISEPDRGLYDGINKGIAMASGDVVGILNSDDVLEGDTTIAEIAAGFSADVDAVYGDIRFVRELGARTVRYCSGKWFRNWMFRFGVFPAHPSTFVRREYFDKFGGYSLDYSICADFEMMLRLFVVHGIRTRYLPICTTVMRLGGCSTAGVRSNLEINRQDLRALRSHGIYSSLPLIYLKYLFKIWGFLRF